MVPTHLVTDAAMLATPTNTTTTSNTTATTTTGGGAGQMALPPEFVALGVAGIVVMTVVWFWLKQGGSSSE